MTPHVLAIAGSRASEDGPNPPPRWRRYMPAWIRRLIWIDEVTHYDAFLSYSWRAESDVAPVVQTVIQRFLCPWYRLRAKTVFRDLSCLPAGAELEEELRRRMDRSGCLIVLASPAAATSRGMEMEAAHWVATRRRDEVVIVIASGSKGEWPDVRSQLLPPSLRTWLTREYILVDLRPEVAALRSNPHDHAILGRMAEALKQLMLRLYPGSTWELLRGEERRQRRIALGWIGAVVVVLSATSAIAGLAAYVALQEAAEARLQRMKADKATSAAIDERRRATENELAARQALQRALNSEVAKDLAISEKQNSARIAELATKVAEDRRIQAKESAQQAEHEKERATVSNAESRARALSIASAEALPGNPQHALLFALHAAAQTWNSHHVVLAETQAALRAAGAATSVVLDVSLDNDLLYCTLNPDVSQVAAHTTGGRLVAVTLQSNARTDLGRRLPDSVNRPAAFGQLQWSNDGQRIGYESMSASFIDLTTRRVHQPELPEANEIRWDPNVRRVAVMLGSGALRVWDSARGEWIFSQPVPARSNSIVWNRSGSLILTRAELRSSASPPSPPGTFNQSLTLWDVDGNREARSYPGPWPFWFDEQLAAGPSDGSRSDIAFFDVTNPALAASARVFKVDMGEAKYDYAGAFSPDSQYLAITGWEKVSIVDVHSGEEVFSVPTKNFRGGIQHEVRWSNDGLRLGVLIDNQGGRGFVSVYAVGCLFSKTPKDLVDVVRKNVNETLSAPDCQRYFSTSVCPLLEFR